MNLPRNERKDARAGLASRCSRRIDVFQLPDGISNALTQAGRARVPGSGRFETACGSLAALLNQVAAQTGKKLTLDQAAQITRRYRRFAGNSDADRLQSIRRARS